MSAVDPADNALLAYIVGGGGKVIGIERIKELKKFGEKNADKFGFVKKNIVKFVEVDGSKGFPEEAPLTESWFPRFPMKFPRR